MKTGEIFTSPTLRWYEPQHALLGGKSYFAHAWGTAYVLSGKTATFLGQLQPNSLRFFMNEGDFMATKNPYSCATCSMTSAAPTLPHLVESTESFTRSLDSHSGYRYLSGGVEDIVYPPMTNRQSQGAVPICVSNPD